MAMKALSADSLIINIEFRNCIRKVRKKAKKSKIKLLPRKLAQRG
jgi:hypothetical protein